jgi:AraC family transcriptional regulator
MSTNDDQSAGARAARKVKRSACTYGKLSPKMTARDVLVRSLMPALIDIQRRLDARLTLGQLAAEHGYSPHHFHRLFTTAVGETPRAHVQRLRLERAAYKLWITDEGVLDIALSVGFRSHETFSRAFRRHFGASPQAFRRRGTPATTRSIGDNAQFAPDDCVLSEVRYEAIRARPVLAIRYVGSYHAIPEPASPDDQHWRKLIDWAREQRIAYQPIALAVFHDDPWLTPESQQRADLCLPVAAPAAGNRLVRCTVMPAGMYAAITHMGPRATRHQAFRRLADAVHASEQFRFPDDPAGAVAMSPFGGGAGVSYTDVYLAVMRREQKDDSKRRRRDRRDPRIDRGIIRH